MNNVLIIDDDETLCHLLTDYLSLKGFQCQSAHTGISGIRMLLEQTWTIAVLDVMLPECDGFEVLRFVRTSEDLAALPILMLTAKSGELDRIAGLESGADDYLGKPFHPDELCARIHAILRRTASMSPSFHTPRAKQMGDVAYNKATLRVLINNEFVPLTSLEFRMLEILLDNHDRIISRETLAQKVLGRSPRPFERTVDIHISRVRAKLPPHKDGGPRIRTIRGKGYVYTSQGGE